MLLTGPGISLDLPPGWEAEIDAGSGAEPSPLRTPRTHIANFALPHDRGDFGSNAVEAMSSGGILICLLEEDPSAAASRLHTVEGVPVLVAGDFGAAAMQRPRPGQVGAQVFFHERGRAFVLYVVIARAAGAFGSDPTGQVRQVNDVLAGVSIHP